MDPKVLAYEEFAVPNWQTQESLRLLDSFSMFKVFG
jgi:hypothetical protein